MSQHLTFIPSTVDVLGCDNKYVAYLWSRVNRKLYKIAAFSDIAKPDLIHWAGWEAVSEVEKALPEEVAAVPVIRNAIAEEARLTHFEPDETIGQGVWRNPGGEGLLLVSGNEVLLFVRNENRIKWTLLNRPVVGGKLIEPGRQWVNPRELKEVVGGLSPKTMQSTLENFISLLSAWTFRHTDDALLVAGLAVGTCVQAALPFRPQVSITGKSQTGKTTLRMLLGQLWPYAEEAEGRTSEAAIRQSLGRDAMPFLFDEAEAWHGRDRVLELFRSSSRGGVIRKGTATGKAVEYRMNHIGWLFAIEDGLRDEADVNRFARITLERGDRGTLPVPSSATPLVMTLLATAMVCAQEIMDLHATLSYGESFKHFGRLAEVYALPVAAYGVICRRSVVQCEEILDRVLEQKIGDLSGRSDADEQDLLSEILSYMPRGCNAPIGKLLNDQWDTSEMELQNIGVRKMDDGIFFANVVLRNRISLSARWSGKDVGELLARLPRARKTRQRVNKRPEWGVLIPREVVIPPDDDDIPF